MRTNFRLPGEAGPFANERLSGLVGGMRLARQHQLHGPLRVGKNAGQPLAIVQQQRWPFVSGEPPCESQCQCLRIQHRLRLAELAASMLRSLPAAGSAVAWRIPPKPHAQLERIVPDLLVISTCAQLVQAESRSPRHRSFPQKLSP